MRNLFSISTVFALKLLHTPHSWLISGEILCFDECLDMNYVARCNFHLLHVFGCRCPNQKVLGKSCLTSFRQILPAPRFMILETKPAQGIQTALNI